MSLTDLVPVVQALPRADKLQLKQFLVTELAREEGISLITAHDYPIWSPYDAFDAAATLLYAPSLPAPFPCAGEGCRISGGVKEPKEPFYTAPCSS